MYAGGGNPAQLKILDTVRGFQIRVNGQFMDTSKIFAKVEPNDLSKIDIFSKDSSLSPKDNLTLSYAITADLLNVNVSDNDSSSSLPNYLVSFMDMQVLSSQPVVADFFSVSPNIPNPFNGQTFFVISLKIPQHVSYSVCDITGKIIHSKEEGMLIEGKHTIKFGKEFLAAGEYEFVFKIGSNLKAFKIIIL